LRRRNNDETLYAFQAGVILEAKHQLPAAIAEYVNALSDNEVDFDMSITDQFRAKTRLVKLSKRPGLSQQITLAFNQKRQSETDPSSLVLDYVDYLTRGKRWSEAAVLLRADVAREVARSRGVPGADGREARIGHAVEIEGELARDHASAQDSPANRIGHRCARAWRPSTGGF